MVKKCKIKLNNDLVTVIDFDERLIQIPSIHNSKAEFVNVWLDNGRYKVVENDFVEPIKNIEGNKKQNKKTRKKTTSTNNEVV